MSLKSSCLITNIILDYLYNFYYSKKKPVTAITTTPTNGDTPDQLETTVEESDSINSHGVYYMKKNQLYNPEFFNGPSISEARPSEGLYDIPEDPDSGPQDLQDGRCHIYDDMDKSMDTNNKITTNIYDMPFEAAECDAAQLQQKKEEKFYESVVEEDSDEEDGNKDETEETRRMNQELNERQITEANTRRRQENMRLGMDRSLINQSSKVSSGVHYLDQAEPLNTTLAGYLTQNWYRLDLTVLTTISVIRPITLWLNLQMNH